MRPIDADKLMVELNEAQVEYDENYRGLCLAKNRVYESPTIEAEPGIHARWIESEEGYFSCSNCHNDAMVELYENIQKLTPFCPYCGAIMNEEV